MDKIDHQKWRVCHAHRSHYPKPIRFRVGDPLHVGHRDTEFDGWWWVTTEDGNSGWAPEPYIDRQACPARALVDYCAIELNTNEGEILWAEAEGGLNDWLWVRNAQGQWGWVPLRTLSAEPGDAGSAAES